MTITTDRILPLLLPGVLALSTRARYLSYYCFLLQEYQDRKLTADNASLGRFIKLREAELAVAVRLCLRPDCGWSATSVLGSRSVGQAANQTTELVERRESVESWMGGYGLVYRSPLATLGLAVLQGSAEVGGEPTPVDLLAPHDRAIALASAYRDSISDTEYYREWFTGTDPIPRPALEEYAERGCLCRLDQEHSERELLRQALFEPLGDEEDSEVRQRRRSFALFLDVTSRESHAPLDSSSFRRGLWNSVAAAKDLAGPRAEIAAQWGAFTAKEFWQEGLSVLWDPFFRIGCKLQSPDGLTSAEVTQAIRGHLLPSSLALPDGSSASIDGDQPVKHLLDQCRGILRGLDPETIRDWAVKSGEPVAGLIQIMMLFEALPDESDMPAGWRVIGSQRSERQPSLLSFGALLQAHLETDRTVADTLEWIIRRHVITAHLEAAYSKSPSNTFRFRWNGGRLRFFPSMWNWRFGTADNRRVAIGSLTQDLGLWQRVGDAAELTADGAKMVESVLG